MITIIDYGVGNLGSVANTLDRLEQPYEIAADPSRVAAATALLLPGVGAAGVGMRNLKDRGLDIAITDAVSRGIPFLGICLGMQLLFDTSEEGSVACLRILKGRVKKFRKERRIPQIGWNTVTPEPKNENALRLFAGIPDDSSFYFVNSYYCVPDDPSSVTASTEYGETFASVVLQNNIVATQFHPEKSGDVGFTLLKNFMEVYL